MLFNKKKSPKTVDDWGFVMKLKLDNDHVIVPAGYNGQPDCGFDIAIVKVPEQYVPKLL